MKIKMFNNWKYRGKWNGNLTNFICFAANKDFHGQWNIVCGLFGVCLFIYV